MGLGPRSGGGGRAFPAPAPAPPPPRRPRLPRRRRPRPPPPRGRPPPPAGPPPPPPARPPPLPRRAGRASPAVSFSVRPPPYSPEHMFPTPQTPISSRLRRGIGLALQFATLGEFGVAESP